VIHTVDNQNVVFMKQLVEFCHPIYVLEVKAAIVITKSTQQRRLCFANCRSQLICRETQEDLVWRKCIIAIDEFLQRKKRDGRE